jgi:hypothetical protein
METWGATDRYWAVTRIRTRDMCVQFHSVVGRLPVRGDFVVRLRYQGRRYAYWYYFTTASRTRSSARRATTG